MRRVSSVIVSALTVGVLTLAATSGATATPEGAEQSKPPADHELPKMPVMRGGGGAVASVDPIVSQVGIDVLEKGGNAADAAVAMAGAVGPVGRPGGHGGAGEGGDGGGAAGGMGGGGGVGEPDRPGVGGGGFFVPYGARAGGVETIGGRETAAESFHEEVFLDEDGEE